VFLRRRRADPVDAVFKDLRRAFADRIAWTASLPETPPTFAEPAQPLPPALQELLRECGIRGLYPQQAQAFDALHAGGDVAIATPTASGKTLAFALPIFARLLAEPRARALLIAPTNALVNDQARTLTAWARALPRAPAVAVLTGATSEEARRALRADPPRLLITNPEMLHLSLCGQHVLWRRFWPGVQFVVLDEMHLYRGVFGAHLAMLMRRVLRVAALHGARPQIAGCSATVGNPEQLGERLTGRRLPVIRADGAGRGPRTLLALQPSLAVTGDRGQATAVELFCGLIEREIGTILFAQTRRGVETMWLQARERLGAELGGRVAPYRGGLAPRERERIERDLKQGRLRGVIATNALELGIDIGGLDAAVIAGFPGSRASFWQQAGRAGRGRRPSLVVFVPFPRALDAYYAAHDRALLSSVLEDVAVDRENEAIIAQHLGCAAAEAPLDPETLSALAPAGDAVPRAAAASGLLTRDGGQWRAGPGASHAAVSLRGSGAETWTVQAPEGEIGTLDDSQRTLEAHLGAVYLHGGRPYRVQAVDHVSHRISVAAEPEDAVSEPLVVTVAAPLARSGARRSGNGVPAGDRPSEAVAGVATAARFSSDAGRLLVTWTTIGYREGKRLARVRRTVTLDPPERREMETAGLWFVFPDELRRRLDEGGRRRFAPALHALEHLLPAAAALRVLCDPRDVVASYEERHELLGGAALFLYDAIAGGCGIAERLSADPGALLALCREIVAGCRCREGCPACVLSAACWRPADPPEKAAALALLTALGPLSPVPFPPGLGERGDPV